MRDEHTTIDPARDAPPRILPLSVNDLTNDLLLILTRMIKVNDALDSRDAHQREAMVALAAMRSGAPTPAQSAAVANLPEIVRTMLRHPELFASLTDVGIQLVGHGALPPRDRELAILRVAWLCRAPYEWGEHVLVAKKVGVTSLEVERITQGSQASGWDEHARAILTAVEELHQDATISDATWATLAKRFDDRQLIELPIVIGQYQALAFYQNALRLRLNEGNPGLSAR